MYSTSSVICFPPLITGAVNTYSGLTGGDVDSSPFVSKETNEKLFVTITQLFDVTCRFVLQEDKYKLLPKLYFFTAFF